MLVKELIAQVRRLEIRTRRTVDELVGGAYHSRFKGRGMEFEEVREYIPGDDIRDIDWNVTARTGAPHIKKYVEERELHVLLAVDISASGLYGSGEKSKLRTAAELGALLALSAARNHDKTGMVTFTDQVESYLPPRSGHHHVLRLIRDIVAAEPRHSGTNLANLCEHLRRALSRRTVIFILSDLIQKTEEWETPLRMLARKHDVILIHIADPMEKHFTIPGDWSFTDAESGIPFQWNASAANRRLFERNAELQRIHLENVCKKADSGLIEITCGEDLVNPLMRYFSLRKRR